LQEGKRLAYGARSLVEGGLQSLPKLSVPGGLLIGDAAGFLNVPKIKGIHTAMKSGMLAAESLFKQLRFSSSISECEDYAKQIKTSWLGKELYQARNIRPALRFGLGLGLLYAAIDTYLLRGKAPWTLHHTLSDYQSLHEAKCAKPIAYPKHDQQVTFDITDSLYLSHLQYGDDHQPPHLLLKNSADAININLKRYASPETRYCPAAVYNIVRDENNEPKLHINYGNCLQCKACDIKDPEQNIVWTPPEGGCGPNYDMM
jgi:electron-transferring-flavoprotein dehydrogenase